MDTTASHMGFVYASYGLTLVVIAGLVICARMRSRRLKAELEAKGLTDPGSTQP